MSNKMKINSKKKKEKIKEVPTNDSGFLAGKRIKAKSSAQSFDGKTSKSFSTKKV